MKWNSKEEAQKAHTENYRSDNVAKQYGSPLQPHYNRVRFVVDNVSSGSLVLDVGCNGGALAIPLLQKRCYVKGVDLVEELVEKAKKRGVFAEVGEAEDLSQFDDNSFDYVICTEVIEHLFDPTKAVQEAYRVLKPGGKYIATVPYYGGRMANDDFLGDYHQQNFTFEMLDTLFHAFFEDGKVFHYEICYPDIFNQRNNIPSQKQEDGSIKYQPQWVGLVAEK
jgi:SAM-dependent methyltransferase